MRILVIAHTKCEKRIGHAVLERDEEPPYIMKASKFYRLDGSQPSAGDTVRERCPHCGDIMYRDNMKVWEAEE